MSRAGESAGLPKIPPQENLKRATELGLRAAALQSDEQRRWLGAEPCDIESGDRAWCLPVLGERLTVDLAAGRITTSTGEEVSAAWRILILHYMSINSRPEARPTSIVFADLPESRTYSGVYQARVISRLCGTLGRDGDALRTAAESLGGTVVEGGDLSFDFSIFPRLTFRLIWHEADDEFGASATLLLPDNIEAYFCPEDIVVLSERLVSRLCGRPF